MARRCSVVICIRGKEKREEREERERRAHFTFHSQRKDPYLLISRSRLHVHTVKVFISLKVVGFSLLSSRDLFRNYHEF